MGIGKPKNQHSLENLKYLYGILNKNQTVTENNKDLLIETLRSISEILIWGDQNDSSVFDFFLEKQMITFFLYYMKQKYGRFICVQLLQTLNILFENIRNETSLYFLLSNNHINNIILHKFDFSDEEVMAYYISFLKTLSLKLNSHSIHFFFNEKACEFPLYVEAIKFFDHPEAMVRIAVRTLTLNVYNVPVSSMQKFVKEKTASFYFSNLVWLIRNQLLDLDICVKNTVDHTKRNRLTDSIDEHIDHLNYLQDIYILNNQSLSNCLTEQLVRRLFVPVYFNSLLSKDRFTNKDCKTYIQPNMALFLLSHLFSVNTYEPLLNDLCELIFLVSDEKVIEKMCTKTRNNKGEDYLSEPKSLVNCLSCMSSSQSKNTLKASKTRSRSTPHLSTVTRSYTDENLSSKDESTTTQIKIESSQALIEFIVGQQNQEEEATFNNLLTIDETLSLQVTTTSVEPKPCPSVFSRSTSVLLTENITDDEKYRQIVTTSSQGSYGVLFESLLSHLNSQEYCELNGLLALSLIYSVINNPGVPAKYIDALKPATVIPDLSTNYNDKIISKLIGIITKSVELDFKVRLSTLELAIHLVKKLCIVNNTSHISDFHLACIEQAREQSAFALRRQFKTEEMFLDMFEHEYQSLYLTESINIESLLRDWSILLPPTSTPLSGIELVRRYPCGDTEKLKQSIRKFFLLRDLCLKLNNELENQLPLTKQEHLVKENDALDLNSSDLIACTVNLKEKKERRFLVIDPIQFILVEPEVKRIGWGIVKFSDLIQDVEVTPDKEDSRSLTITIKKSPSVMSGKLEIRLNSVFTFDDHIRCMAAKQHLVRARERARRMKLEKIGQLLDIVSSSNNNNINAKNFMGASTTSDILSYNIVAGFNNMLGNINHPGRATHISQTWSQFANTERHSSLVNSPMAALNSSPLARNQSIPSTSSIGTFYASNQLVSPSLKSINLMSSSSIQNENEAGLLTKKRK